MIAKTIFLACAQAFLIQSISSQCIGSVYNAYDGLGYGPVARDSAGPYGYAATPGTRALEFASGYSPAASNGGGFIITSASPIAPTGVAVTSENAYEGPLAVTGALPFLAAVALEGPLPTLGTGAVTYGAGNGNVAILNEDFGGAGYGPYGGFGAAGYGPYGAYGSAAAEFGYGYAASPLAYEAAIAGPTSGYRGCGYGPVHL